MNKLNLSIPLNNRSYGIVGSYLLYHLSDKYNISLFPISSQSDLSSFEPYIQKTTSELLQSPLNNFDIKSPSIRLWHQFDLIPRYSSTKQIGFTIFELNRFTDVEKASIESVDHLIVCSEWAKEIVLTRTKQTNVNVVPLGVDPNVFYPGKSDEEKSYTFFHVGKTELRKGHDVLCEAFNNAFTEKDNVELHISWYNPFLSKEDTIEWIKYYKTSELGDKIRFVPWFKIQAELANTMRQSDCGIFPSRAEGFNLPVLEMMACGKPVIVTNYSGHTAFCNDTNSFLINSSSGPEPVLESAYDGKWFFSQGDWLRFGDGQMEQTVEYMKYCYKNRIRDNEKGLETAQTLTWENMTSNVKAIVETI